MLMLSKRIYEFRTSFGWTQVQLAQKLGVTKQTVSNWENENIQPSIEMLVRIAKLFHTSTDYLLGLDNAPTINVADLPAPFIAHLVQIIEAYKHK